jgi:hypothetical protein
MPDAQSSSVSDRMRRQLDRPKLPPTAPRPVDAETAGGRPYPRRITLDLTDEDHLALKQAALDNRVTMADLLRALVDLWQSDHAVAEDVARRFARVQQSVAQ